MKSVSPTFVSTNSTARCCNSRQQTFVTDPYTNTAICSCKLQTSVPAYLSTLQSLPDTQYSTSVLQHINKQHARSAFYQTLPGDKHSINTGRPNIHPYYIEHMMAAHHPYGAAFPGFDINGNRRKNASKESTGPLKAWLYQHRKNPYPTKGEKVMLAIISQMTLTQVSTWFANARRRLKKESKMSDKDVDLSDIDIDDSGIQNESFSSHVTDSDTESPSRLNSDISDTESHQGDKTSGDACAQRLFSPDVRTENHFERNQSPGMGNKATLSLQNDTNSDSEHNISSKDSKLCQNKTNATATSHINGSHQKPKIWSIAEMIG